MQNTKRGVARVMIRLMMILGTVSLIYYAALAAYLGPKVGFELIWLALGAVMLGAALILKHMSPSAARMASWVLGALMAVGLAAVIAVESVIVAGSLSVPQPGADYVVVLGARVKESGPSRLLTYRINKAAEYLEENDAALAILCGGQGQDEPMSEAQAMYEALVQRGIDEDRLIIEDQSTNTAENLRNASLLMENAEANVVVTTTGYHMYRALACAREQGLEHVSGNPAECARLTLPNYYLREFFAVVRDWIL